MTEDTIPPPPKHRGGKFRKDGSGNPGGKKRVVALAQSPDAQIENAAPKQRRYGFQPGQSGNPAGKAKGTRHRATMLAEALFDGQAEALVRKAIEMALAGDPTAMRLALERLCPPRRERPVNLAMPSIKAAGDLIVAASVLTEATAAGDITPGEAASLSMLVGNVAKAVETFELAERLSRLEERIAAQGGTP
jgi:Family of unknown function (DUF5681)